MEKKKKKKKAAATVNKRVYTLWFYLYATLRTTNLNLIAKKISGCVGLDVEWD
jgi:hypothetical protein